MKFDTLLRKLEERNPDIMRAETIKIKTACLRDLLEQAWHCGHAEGTEAGRNEKPLFEQIFGKSKK